jgi:hypothetical protein
MGPRFHQEALRRLGVVWAPDPAAMLALAARASHLGIALPASFAEWYGMRDGIELLKRKQQLRRAAGRARRTHATLLASPVAWRKR